MTLTIKTSASGRSGTHPRAQFMSVRGPFAIFSYLTYGNVYKTVASLLDVSVIMKKTTSWQTVIGQFKFRARWWPLTIISFIMFIRYYILNVFGMVQW